MNSPSNPLLLAIESSGRECSLAITRGERLLVDRRLPSGSGGRAQALLPLLKDALTESNIDPKSIDVVAVGIGPGSFTGLRIGIVTAKVFAHSAGAALVGCDDFTVVAEALPPEITETFVVEDAQRGDLFVGKLQRDANGRWERVGEIAIEPAEPWCTARSATDYVTGPGLAKVADRLRNHCRLAAEDSWRPSASALARVGLRDFENGVRHDPVALEPLYLRRSSAEDRWEERHGTS